MITMNIFKRPMNRLGDLKTGEAFKLVGREEFYQIIDLTKTDGFLPPGPTLRDDVVYCSNILTGEVCVHQKIIDVEVVDLKLTEVINVAST